MTNPFKDDDQTIAEPVKVPLRQGTVELSYSEVPADESSLATPWRAIDVCTRNTIYALDARLMCTGVIDRATGEIRRDHAFVGARLVGGAFRTEDGRLTAVAHPLPEAGMCAVFQGERANRRWYNETSDVTRIIIRQRVVTFEGTKLAEPKWEEITGSSKKTRRGSPDF